MLRALRSYTFPFIAVSWLPITTSIMFGTVAMTIMTWMRGYYSFLPLLVAIVGFIAILVVWMRALIYETGLHGNGSQMMNYALASGILLFILSELMVFAGFFWGWFTFTLTPELHFMSYDILDPFHRYYMDIAYATLNTMLLSCSGFACSAAQIALRAGFLDAASLLLVIAILLAAAFTVVQVFEYADNVFDITTGTYGTCFYVLTGLHGLHVQIGTTLLIFSLLRIVSGFVPLDQHTFILGALFYWHFVDVVWVFLYLIVYLSVNG